MSRIFKFEQSEQSGQPMLASISGSSTKKGPGDIVIAEGNSSRLVDNSNYADAPAISSPALTITPKL